jgi:hypothetical protein
LRPTWEEQVDPARGKYYAARGRFHDAEVAFHHGELLAIESQHNSSLL